MTDELSKLGNRNMSSEQVGDLSFAGSLTAVHLRPVPHATCTDAIGPTDGFIAKVSRGDKIIGTRVSDPQRRIAADAQANDIVSLTAQGAASHNEDDTLEAARILIQVLRAHGEQWGDPFDARHELGYREGGVDVIARSRQNELLQIQVTRAIRDPCVWRDLSVNGNATNSLTPDAAADELYRSLDHKAKITPMVQRANTVLLLDATIAAHLALPPVVLRFHEQYHASVSALRYQSVWCVGPHVDMVFRLDRR